MKGTIELGGMRFRGYHGCLESEKTLGGDFVVDLRYGLDITEAAASDRLEDALDYSRVYGVVAACMERPSELLENLAARIADTLLAEFPQIEGLELKVSKKNPPLPGPVECSSVTIIR